MAGAPASLPQGRASGGDLLILVTLGTHPQPFERALDLVAPLGADDHVVVQHGHTPPRHGLAGFEWFELVSYDHLVELIDGAATVVCHAGIGSIVSALARQKTPVVIPRLHRHGEHVDDHQLQITNELGARGLVVPLLDGDDVREALRRAAGAPRASVGGSGTLRRAIRLAAG